jgi:hypothetical protein
MYQNSITSTALVLCLPFFALVFCGCSNSAASRQQEKLLAQLDSNQVVMTEFTRQQTGEVLKIMNDKLQDPALSERAKIWQPRARQITDHTKAITASIEKIISQLDTFTVYDLFTRHNEGRDLFTQLVKYKSNVLKADERIYTEFNKKIMPSINLADSNSEIAAGKYIKQNISHLSRKEAIVLLHKLEQQATLTECRLISYCNNHIALGCMLSMEISSVLVSQSSTILQQGETLTIAAGIGSFSAKAQPKIIINGKLIDREDDPVAYYKMKITQGKGKYSIPVHIDYIDENGIAASHEVIVDYTVR